MYYRRISTALAVFTTTITVEIRMHVRLVSVPRTKGLTYIGGDNLAKKAPEFSAAQRGLDSRLLNAPHASTGDFFSKT
jgi:hypothetical protein